MSAPGYAVANALYVYCEGVMDELLLTPLGLWLLPAPGIPGAGGWRIETAPEATPQADPAFTSSLTSSVASLPFLGNWLVGLSFVLNASTPASATAGYKVALRRQSDCSLDEDLILPGGTMPEAEYITSLTGAQDYFHQLSGLTTTPDVFANGCDYQVLGLPAPAVFCCWGPLRTGQLSAPNWQATGCMSGDRSHGQYGYHDPAQQQPERRILCCREPKEQRDLRPCGDRAHRSSNLGRGTAVFLGNGDGTFKAPVYYDVAETGTPGDFTIDDVTGDGIPDIVILSLRA